MYQVVAAHVGVRVPNRVIELLQRDAVSKQALRVRPYLVSLDRAAAGNRIDDPRYPPQLANQYPVHLGLQIVQVIEVAVALVARALERKSHDFARGAGRRNLRLDTLR